MKEIVKLISVLILIIIIVLGLNHITKKSDYIEYERQYRVDKIEKISPYYIHLYDFETNKKVRFYGGVSCLKSSESVIGKELTLRTKVFETYSPSDDIYIYELNHDDILNKICKNNIKKEI